MTNCGPSSLQTPLYLSNLLAAFITGLCNLRSFSVDLLYSLSMNTPLGSFFLFLNRWSTSLFSLNLTLTGLVLIGLYLPVNESFDSDVKEGTDASTSQESACSRSSSATPETCPFSSSSSSTSTSVQAVNFVSGHQTQGEYGAVSPVVVESPGTSKERSTDDVMTEFCSLHEELQTICPGMSTELESLNKSMTGNESMCPSRVDYNLRSVHTVWQWLRQRQENVAITIGFHCI